MLTIKGLNDFNATKILVGFADDDGASFLIENWGLSVLEVAIPKSKAGEFTDHLDRKGIEWMAIEEDK